MKINIAPIFLEQASCIAVRIDGFDAEFPVLMRKIPEQRAWVVSSSLSITPSKNPEGIKFE